MSKFKPFLGSFDIDPTALKEELDADDDALSQWSETTERGISVAGYTHVRVWIVPIDATVTLHPVERVDLKYGDGLEETIWTQSTDLTGAAKDFPDVDTALGGLLFNVAAADRFAMRVESIEGADPSVKIAYRRFNLNA